MPDIITIPVSDYRRLIEAAGNDADIVHCEVCGAWMDISEDAYCGPSEEDICWKRGSDHNGKFDHLCVRHRAIEDNG